jgi:hypothetical protein
MHSKKSAIALSWWFALSNLGHAGSRPGYGIITHKTTREGAVAGYCGLLWPFKIRRMAAIVFQFRVVAGTP